MAHHFLEPFFASPKWQLMRNFIIAICFFLAAHGHSQQWVWDSLAPAGYQGDFLEKDPYGYLYAFSLFDTSVNKFSSTGQLVKQIKVPKKFKIQSITCSPDSSLYVLGLFTGTMTVNGHLAISRGGDDICLAKYSPAGNIQWLVSCGSKRNDLAADICMQGTDILLLGTAGDTLHFSSHTLPTDTLNAIFVARFFSTGQLDVCQIANNINHSQYDHAHAEEIATDQQGNIYGLVRMRGSYAWGNDTIVLPHGQHLLNFSANLVYLNSKTLSNQYGYHACDIKVNSQDEVYYVLNIAGKYSFNTEINKLSSVTSPTVNHYRSTGTIWALDLDSCDNVYFIGQADNYWPGPHVPLFWNYVGMMSPGGQLNWLRNDSADFPIGVRELASIGLNKVFCIVYFHDTLTLLNTYTTQPHASQYVNAILQATFGIPTNVTPSPYSVCSGKTMTLSCSTGGVIHWFNSATSLSPLFVGSNFTVNPPGAGNYTYYAEARTCTFVTGRIAVPFTVSANPTISVSDATICAGDNFVITPSPSLTYSVGGGNLTVSPITDQSYLIYGTDVAGCSDTAICKITVKPTPNIFIQPSQNPVCRGSGVTMSVSGAASYSLNQSGIQVPFTFTPNVSVNLFVSATGTNNCSATTSYVQKVDDCASLFESGNEGGVSFYPNPSNGSLTLRSKSAHKIRIIDSIGRLVLSKEVSDTETKIDLSGLMDGIYFVEAQFEKKTETQKLVLKK